MIPIQDFTAAIKQTHGCDSVYIETADVREEFNGRLMWEGKVGLFRLIDHPTAKECYVWRILGADGGKTYVAVLKRPPVETPIDAVRLYLIGRGECGK